MVPIFTLKLKLDSEDNPKDVAQSAIYIAKKLDVYVKFKWRGQSLTVSPWDREDSLVWELTAGTM